ncbi:hypothetical protein Ddye_029370 [Dipteronia dyeriana]|uniref:FAS1 domain-containing protein n=1 Tax=Dipteronia dyeriana TaxID=168575 RepID=A0AAD9WLR5_9ROSI|nr:hypothetical protein Ddye_029370 [Dipteronia dyeriana]
MAKSFLLLLLLLLLNATIMSASSPPQQQQQQLKNIIDALIGAGDFNSWANILSSADPTVFPVWATFFIPSDSSEAVDRMAMVMAYHIVPQRLSFSELCLLKPLTRLPTLLPTKSILVTNNSVSNFTLDDSLLSHPHLYTTSTFVVHGIQTFLDYSVYGGDENHPLPPLPTPPPPPQQAQFTIESESDAACLCLFSEFMVFLLVVCGVLIQHLLVV